ncbi:hypothetical protein CLV58_10750 [Spirosoma oryzae]|uniref:CRISPR-associated protein Csh1 n=1 Tax=Spirosoma oryzae TaxID=1469603 RepID=A0A2T0T2S7_9BACT|nr:hypothetical protein [Spirosoma oryzae]PRY39957.1 hypothetical protein CLV58_10750 [Spirosoma oryzae]
MIYTVLKQSGTYAETLEWLGFGYFLQKLCGELYCNEDVRIMLSNEPHQYCISVNRDITQADLATLSYFWVLPFIKKEAKTPTPEGIPLAELRNYSKQKDIRNRRRAEREEIQKDKTLSGLERKLKLKELAILHSSELEERLDLDFDVYREMVRNPYPAYLKLFENFNNNRADFRQLIWEILSHYTKIGSVVKSHIKTITVKITAQQLYSPNQGKGSNREKADGPKAENLDGFWIPETMKLAGALQTMFCQYVKVGTGLDLKVNVPEFNEIEYQQVNKLLSSFKKTLTSNSAIKVDILNVLAFCKAFIENSPEYNSNSGWRRIKITNSMNGFYSVIQKDLGQNRAVVNMSFLGIPTFIEYRNVDEAETWLTILNEQGSIIKSIEEQGDSIDGLRAYRSFLSGSDLNNFFQFSTFYATYLTRELAAEHYYVKPFNTEHLNQFFSSMSTETLKLEEIITNPGFISVARAIRNSTIRLQFKPKKERNFNVRYGLSQELQTKSKSTDDLATFIGEFVSSYNTETARSREKLLDKFDSWNAIPDHLKKSQRSAVEDDEIASFYMLLNKYEKSPRLIGAMLAAYGFARTKWDNTSGSKAQDASNEPDNTDDGTEVEETDIDF